jgi:hypothetical protein
MALVVIFILYATIGVLAAVGSISITKRFEPRVEQATYGLALVPVAAVYLAFLRQLGPAASWRAEFLPVVGFVALGLAGTRLAPLLMLGYLGHGAWDLIHEAFMLQGSLGRLTPIPVAYGVFCAVFDWVMVGYFWTRRKVWLAARQSG